MTREEAISAGMEVREIQHSMKRRTPWHDYSRRGTYMLTLVVRDRMAILGTLRGSLEGEVKPYVELSALGNAIVQVEQKKINQFYPPGGGLETMHYAGPFAHDCKNQREHEGERASGESSGWI